MQTQISTLELIAPSLSRAPPSLIQALHQGRGARNRDGGCKNPSSLSTLATPLASYRIGFGPLARKRKNRKNIENGLPQKIGKNSRKIGEWPRNPVFEPSVLFFGYFFSYIFWRRPFFYIFPIFFSFFGPPARNLFCSWPTGSQLYTDKPVVNLEGRHVEAQT